MTIQWLGGDTILLTSKLREKGNVTVVADPVGPFSPARIPKNLKADIVIGSFSQNEHDIMLKSADGERPPIVIRSPGEYERGGVFVTGIAGWAFGGAMSTLYRIDAEELSIGYLAGAMDRLDEGRLSPFEGVHILVLPFGGLQEGKGLALEDARELVQTLEPLAVIPIRIKDSTHPSAKSLQEVGRALGVTPTISESALKLTRSHLGDGETLLLFGFEQHVNG